MPKRILVAVGAAAVELAATPAGGHVGLLLLRDLARTAGGSLEIDASPSRGTRLHLEVESDVVLMDLSMPGMGGVEATRRLLADHRGLQVVMLTSFSDQEQVLDASTPAPSATCSRTPTPASWSTRSGRPPSGGRPSTPRSPGPCSPGAPGRRPRSSSASASARS
jgi:CheY-like chemotaxis protein